MKTPAVGVMTERASHVVMLGSARRRRERKSRSVCRHELVSIKMAVLCATHHSQGVLGEDRVVPIVVRILVSWLKEE